MRQKISKKAREERSNFVECRLILPNRVLRNKSLIE